MGNVPMSPRPQLYPRSSLLHEVHPVSTAQHLYLRPLTDGNDVDTVAFVRVDIEAFSHDAANPAVRNGPVVLRAVALDETGCYFRYRNDRALRDSQEFGEDLQHLGLNEQTSLCHETELTLESHRSQIRPQALIGNNAQKRNEDLIEPRFELRIRET